MEGNIILEGTFGGKLFLDGNHSIFWQETNFWRENIFGGKFKFKIQTPGAAEEPRRTWSYYYSTTSNGGRQAMETTGGRQATEITGQS